MINMPRSTCQEDRVYAGRDVFLALMTVQAVKSIHISKRCPGFKTRPLVTAKVLVSASLCLFLPQMRCLLRQTGSDTEQFADPESIKHWGKKETNETQTAHTHT